MKHLSLILKVLVLAAPLWLASCIGHKKTVETKPAEPVNLENRALLEKVNSNSQTGEFVTSKIRFSVEMGALSQSLTGNLKMKRDDVIRLQLMAFGFVEAGRIEFTKEYVLIIDRINKQFLRVPYHHVDFLRNSGINFYTLQAMFWNELFLPGFDHVSEAQYDSIKVQGDSENTILSYEKDKMTYSWLTESTTGRIKMANIIYTPRQGGNTQLNWDYRSFAMLGRKAFPDDMSITLTTPDKEVKLGVRLNYLNTDSDWETRTQVSSKYSEVDVDEILRRFMAL